MQRSSRKLAVEEYVLGEGQEDLQAKIYTPR